MTSRNDRHRRRAHRRDLAMLRSMVKAPNASRAATCNMARAESAKRLAEQRAANSQELWDAAVRGIGMSTTFSMYWLVREMFAVELVLLANALGYRRK